MKRPILSLFIATVAGVGVVILLYWLSDQRQHSGDFYRVYPTHPVIPLARKAVDPLYTYFAGTVGGEVILASSRNPMQLMLLAGSTLDTSSTTLVLDHFAPLKFTAIVVEIDSPNFYVSDGSQPFVLRGFTKDWVVRTSVMKGLHFKDVIPLGNTSFAISAVNVAAHENVLAKKTGTGEPSYNSRLLEKQLDGIFCTDGMLHYNDYLNELIYVYYYRNQYVIADTNLVLKSRNNTIDTFAHAQIKSAVLSYETRQSYQLAAPPLAVNRRSHSYKHWLFVVSNVEALNEIEDEFKKSSVIDVYDLNSNTYAFSFYLPDEGDKLRHVLVSDQKLYALYPGMVHAYTLNPRYFRE